MESTGAGDDVVMSIAGHVSRAMLSRYSHVRMESKRRALDGIAMRRREADDRRKKDAERQDLLFGPCRISGCDGFRIRPYILASGCGGHGDETGKSCAKDSERRIAVAMPRSNCSGTMYEYECAATVQLWVPARSSIPAGARARR